VKIGQPPETNGAARLRVAADIARTLVFATEGALTAINRDLDLLGVMVLAFAAALGGGIVRDTLLGDLPPASLRHWRYSGLVLGSGAAVFFCIITCRRFRCR
jgi:uncharacterized membrane protein YeiH